MTLVQYHHNVSRYDGTSIIRVTNTEGKVVDVPMGGYVDITPETITKLQLYVVFVNSDGSDVPPGGGGGGGGGGGSTGTSDGHWKAPVASQSVLPTSGNAEGDVRVAIAEKAIFIYQGTTWQQAAGAGGGGGGSVPTGTPTNLFVQQVQPDSADMLIDSLWIPVDGSGNPASPATWQVFTGTGDGNGGNLIISQNQPTSPTIDTLWIPISNTGVPSDLYSWKVLTGHGSVLGAGNDNLFFQPTQPSGAPTGSLWIPLNSSDQSPKTMDNWRVFA